MAGGARLTAHFRVRQSVFRALDALLCNSEPGSHALCFDTGACLRDGIGETLWNINCLIWMIIV
jgi:hypothetical protein